MCLLCSKRSSTQLDLKLSFCNLCINDDAKRGLPCAWLHWQFPGLTPQQKALWFHDHRGLQPLPLITWDSPWESRFHWNLNIHGPRVNGPQTGPVVDVDLFMFPKVNGLMVNDWWRSWWVVSGPGVEVQRCDIQWLIVNELGASVHSLPWPWRDGSLSPCAATTTDRLQQTSGAGRPVLGNLDVCYFLNQWIAPNVCAPVVGAMTSLLNVE